MIKRTENKIGRNDSCPCGSGKKYKKCCLRGPLQSKPVRITDKEVLYDEKITGGRDERVRSMLEVVQVVYDRSRQNKAWNSSDEVGNVARFDALRIEITLNEIARCTSEVLRSCPHSRQYWFIVLRRFAPLLWEDLQTVSKFAGSLDWFSEITKGAGHLVLACSSAVDPWEWLQEGDECGINYRGLSRQEIVVAAQVFSLAQLRYEAQVRFRFACKGFRVFAEANENDPITTQDTASIKRYEERREKYETFTGSAGLWCDPVEIVRIRKDLCLWFGLSTAVPNHFVLRSKNPPEEIDLKYIFSPFFETTASFKKRAVAKIESDDAASFMSFIPYDRLIEHPELRSAFESAFGFKSELIVAFLYSVFRLIYTFIRYPRLDFIDEKIIELVWVDEPDSLRRKVLHHWRDAGVLGLLRSSKAAWIERLQFESAHIHEVDGSVPELDMKQIEELVNKFTWKEGMPVYSNTPVLFTEVSSHTHILDCFSAGDFLRHVLLAVNIVSKVESSSMYGRDLTGTWLETQATTYFTRKLGLPSSKVINGKVVQKTREIDIAFVFNRTLFVIDCKAMAKDAPFMEGQHQRIRNRHTEMLKELNKKNRQRIDLIEQGLVRDVIAPESFDRAYGLVCTSAVEYLPIADDAFWSNSVPLVGPPEELLDTIHVLSSQ